MNEMVSSSQGSGVKSVSRIQSESGLSLTQALGLAQPPGVVSIVGAGGKSSLMFRLGHEWPGRVLLTTTTRIFSAQMQIAPRAYSLAEVGWEKEIGQAESGALLVGSVEGERALGVPPGLPQKILRNFAFDAVVVEADGSRMLPVKAPASHEPVIADGSSAVIAVAGIDAFSGPLAEVAHRPEYVSAITGVQPESTLTPLDLAELLSSPRGGRKHVTPQSRFIVLLNKVESEEEKLSARETARALLAKEGVARVVIGALRIEDSKTWEAWCHP